MIADQLHARLTVLEGLVMGLLAQSREPDLINAVAREHVADVLKVLDGDPGAASLASALRHQLALSIKGE
ncbi:hypothetical protein D0B54_03300 [Solimonas sp. K1W22B-7]|uniref:hypothetical protein n=1 Tax=Solimonas sp. K1W22B-7 TaxID=2303331 RepID=UPI000E32D541|nr:hypothetical protein [Solimonas sp. K1W22B-7]AXQ27756.1 hypothetical protein D0B54_03300 [Solimonas sp. K1W22B-7]